MYVGHYHHKVNETVNYNSLAEQADDSLEQMIESAKYDIDQKIKKYENCQGSESENNNTHHNIPEKDDEENPRQRKPKNPNYSQRTTESRKPRYNRPGKPKPRPLGPASNLLRNAMINQVNLAKIFLSYANLNMKMGQKLDQVIALFKQYSEIFEELYQVIENEGDFGEYDEYWDISALVNHWLNRLEQELLKLEGYVEFHKISSEMKYSSELSYRQSRSLLERLG